MKDSRRGFIRKLALAGTAAITAPGIIMASGLEEGSPVDHKNAKIILFQGDSITDGGRSYDADWNHVYGQDYNYLITARMNYEHPERDFRFFNRGISGNTVADLAARWQKDTLDLKPDVLSILIGVNDVFAVIVKGSKATADDFANSYSNLLDQTKQTLPDTQLVLCEPFILNIGMVSKAPDTWAREVQKRQRIVKQLAQKYNAVYVPFQDAFNKALQKAPAGHWIWDGVHPMPAGHELMAREWLKKVKELL
ncbi:SGNH/GDSL hydrolase family protein [Mucilaginibacter phyllosphaerae]|uniref:Lysophospholipase n=1 Tax=Mucilaginibacter phyllosphaerae TaxID=1812349 RepID=A0A4Y8ACZ7_9SPHI|nr:SGNH/GDSL hydrolase family protein [Mucilaginibacter phyllosphaerae]MBB3970051.1 lysophospholipase L1-like esterase [Mucilaginibacter phyllosphaerae]TEW66443.1 lysophospholipase [Mucilaginibacter phyllosphaerae]GGH09447.1 lipase [Mucilaginibacter phyllosphaerae]